MSGNLPWNPQSALSVTLVPRLLLCLRICAPVTEPAARLDTRLVASDYPGGIPTFGSDTIINHLNRV